MVGPSSLHRRLVLFGLAGGLLVSLCAAWLLGEAFRSTAERAQLRMLEQELAGLIGRIEVAADRSIRLRDRPGDPDYQRIFSGRYWQLGRPGEELGSRSLWDFHLKFEAPAQPRATLSRHPGPAGQNLLVLRQALLHPRLEQPLPVWVAVDETPLLEDLRAFRRLTLIAVGVLFVLLALVLAVQVRHGLRPLRQLATQLAELRRGERERLTDAPMPAELRPLAEHLDRLLAHHERSMRRARHAAVDLAHELKTPLAALDAAAQRGEPTLAATVRAQCARIKAVIQRQLGGSLAPDFRARTEAAPAAEALLNLMRRIHAERELRIEADVPSGLRFPCSAEDLEELLGNLLDNACKWAASRVRLRAGAAPGKVWLEVDDDGPGLAAEAAQKARQRGVRLDQRVPGSGQGLAIVDEIVEVLDGRLALGRSPLGGLSARIELPLEHG